MRESRRILSVKHVCVLDTVQRSHTSSAERWYRSRFFWWIPHVNRPVRLATWNYNFQKCELDACGNCIPEGV